MWINEAFILKNCLSIYVRLKNSHLTQNITSPTKILYYELAHMYIYKYKCGFESSSIYQKLYIFL